MNSEPPTDTRTARQRATYGVALLLDDGDLALEDGRFVQIEGLANLRQGLQLRLATPLADDRLDVRYGLDVSDAFTAALPRPLVKDVLRMSIIRSLASDPRVASVESVLFDDDPEFLAVHPEAGDAGSARRNALVEITVTPVPPAPDPSNPLGGGLGVGLGAGFAGGALTGTAPAGTGLAGTDATVQVVADVRW